MLRGLAGTALRALERPRPDDDEARVAREVERRRSISVRRGHRRQVAPAAVGRAFSARADVAEGPALLRRGSFAVFTFVLV